MKLLIINGPNINLLGMREPEIYGNTGYDSLCDMLYKKAANDNDELEIMQSNCEGALIDRIQKAITDNTQALIINPGAYTHYSIAIRDALASLSIPKIEIHISNIYTREEFRNHSITAPVCNGQIAGLGTYGYLLAMDAAKKMIKAGK